GWVIRCDRWTAIPTPGRATRPGGWDPAPRHVLITARSRNAVGALGSHRATPHRARGRDAGRGERTVAFRTRPGRGRAHRGRRQRGQTGRESEVLGARDGYRDAFRVHVHAADQADTRAPARIPARAVPADRGRRGAERAVAAAQPGTRARIESTIGAGPPLSANRSGTRPASSTALSSSASGKWVAPILSRRPRSVQDSRVQWRSRYPGRITTASGSVRSANPPQKHGCTPTCTNTPPGRSTRATSRSTAG